ncbi:MAG: type VI secretion system amidase effector protein Tae4 [Pseudomonadota bacterium]
MTIVFRELWYAHPINESVQTPCIAPADGNYLGSVVKKGFPTHANQCAIRIGIALKRAGVRPDEITGCLTCGAHDPALMHYIRATEMANALVRARIDGIGRVERLTGNAPADFYPQLFGRTGIIFIKDYWHRSVDQQGRPTGDHIDVWNGYRSSAKWLMEWFSWLGYYSNYAEAKEIWFWPVD